MNKKAISFVLILVIMTLAFASVANASSNRLLRLGSRGSDVKNLQQRLNSLGYNCGNADGIFGTRTYNAVRAFQRKNGLAVDGIVGKDTRSKLFSGSTTPPKGGTSTPPSSNAPITGLLRRGSRGSQVVTLQNRLNQLGYNCGRADGIFGTATYNAVVRFQRAKGLAVDGIVGKNTINKLYEKTPTPPAKPAPTPPAKPKPTPTPTPAPEEMYRVRKTWNDPASQIGAFRNLAGAKSLADANPGYKVFDSSGTVVYENKPVPKPVPKPDPNPEVPTEEISILSGTKSNVAQMQAWARSKGATETFISLAPIYMDVATKAGVNPEGAYAQAAHETGYGKFGGVIDETYCNPCGFKTSEGGGDYDRDAHHKFENWEQGIQAHVDHLALYAGANGYPKADSPDPRHFTWLTGSATTFKGLEGKWATSSGYGSNLERLIQDILNTRY